MRIGALSDVAGAAAGAQGEATGANQHRRKHPRAEAARAGSKARKRTFAAEDVALRVGRDHFAAAAALYPEAFVVVQLDRDRLQLLVRAARVL